MKLPFSRSAATVGLLILFASLGTAAAQRADRAARVGYLTAGSESDHGRQRRFQAFRQALRDLGYVEGQSIAFEFQWADGQYNRLDRKSVV